MKDDFNIDLLDPEDKGVEIAGVPLAYTVGIYPKNFTTFRLINIDARTGQLLSYETLTYKK